MIKKIINNKLFRQLFKFGIVGTIAFAIDYGIFTLLTQVINMHYLISSIISFSISVIFNYIMSVKWVFDITKKQTAKEFIIFILLSVVGLIINSIVLYILVENAPICSSDVAGFHELISKVIATIIVMIFNFITRKIFLEK